MRGLFGTVIVLSSLALFFVVLIMSSKVIYEGDSDKDLEKGKKNEDAKDNSKRKAHFCTNLSITIHNFYRSRILIFVPMIARLSQLTLSVIVIGIMVTVTNYQSSTIANYWIFC